jgi:signal transduction histidine kinase/ligand-binding sensor domain-containing protein
LSVKAPVSLATVFVILATASSARATDLHNVLTEYGVTSWSQRDGLPQGQVDAIAQDTEGYLWVGTRSGLFRFDGVRFTIADALSATKLPRKPVRALHVARDGSLWVGFGDGGGVACMRRGQVTHERASERTPRGAINGLIEDPSGSLWAAGEQGLFRFSAGRWEHRAEDDGLPAGPAYSVYLDARDRLLVGMGNGIYARAAGAGRFALVEEFARHTHAFFETPIAIGEDPDGIILVNDPIVGYRRLSGPTPASAPHDRGRGVHLLLDRRRNLWVGTSGQGLWRVRRVLPSAGFTTERMTALTGLLSDGVQSLFEDRDENIWVGTTEGLHRLTRSKVGQITNVGLVEGVEAMPDGAIWVATVEELLRFADPSVELPTDRIVLRGAKLRAMHADASGTLWVATEDYVGRVVNGRIDPDRALGDGLPREIDSMTSDGRGGLWLHDEHLGFFRWTHGHVERAVFPADLQGTRVIATYTDRTGRVWIAFADGQLGAIDTSGGLRLYGPDDGASGGPYRAMHEDAHGTVWLAGAEGLTRLVAGRFQTVRRGRAFPMGLTAVVDDNAGSLYLGSRSGILRISESAFENGLATGTLRYTLYDRSDGLAGLPLSYVNNRRVVRARDNRLWFVTARGLTLVDPRALRETRPSPPIRIESVVAGDNPAPASPGMALPPRTARVEIDYTVLNLTSPLRERFRYRLEGFDPDWIDAGSRRQAFYTNLPPRRYRFRVDASSANGVWDDGGAVWDFSIQPTFYETTWFRSTVATVLVTGLVFAIWAAWQLRLRQVRRQFSLLLGERVRLSREIHDTLLQSLVGVALQLDALACDTDPSLGTGRERFVRIRKQVEEYIREARQSIWNLRSPSRPTHDLAGALRDAGAHATDGSSARFELIASGTPRQTPPNVGEQLLRIGREAVTNAVRHASAREVRMQLEYEPDAVVLRVSDDGHGFDPVSTPQHQHYGLMSMRERASEIGGVVTIASSAGHGTEITAVVPLR